MCCRRRRGIGRVGSVWYPILKAVLEPQFEVPMAQVDRVAPFLGFIFGTPFLGPAFEAIFVLELASQAYSFYRWANCIPPDNILVNMDECSLAAHVEGCRGTVLRSVRGAVRASLSTQRSRMTLLASVSTDFGFNAILPQVIIANKTQFPIKFMKSLDPAITDWLKIWRGATAWNTAAFMCSYLRLYMRGGNLTALKSLWRSSSTVLHATSILLWGHWPKHWGCRS